MIEQPHAFVVRVMNSAGSGTCSGGFDVVVVGAQLALTRWKPPSRGRGGKSCRGRKKGGICEGKGGARKGRVTGEIF